MYSYSRYLDMLKLAKRSDATITTYAKILRSYAKFLGVPPDEIHNHLTTENLVRYANSRANWSESGTQMRLSILHRYFTVNGVTFDPLEFNVLKAQRFEEPDDKPLTLELLQKMMDSGNAHTRAIIATLVSTGMRSGECSKILLSDLSSHGGVIDTIHIRPEIAKGRRGGDVYLTSEAREYIDLWLKQRDRYIRNADRKNKYLVRSGHGTAREKNDKRLFACSYTTLLSTFSYLYDLVDGEPGKYHARITPHSCRKYFRTHAVRTMPLDLVEKLMRHSGYLTESYVRITDEEACKAFHAGEAALYITRGNQRATTTEIEMLKQERDELLKLKAKLDELEAVTALMTKYMNEKKEVNRTG